ncbi:PP0621 family protein [Paraherbaspirillum soli]|uniref:PP0621 family protein n=1 Tax=Paraherbaspirillum soli TaxID=631222 RepID=A0ABW0MH63_9BURK
MKFVILIVIVLAVIVWFQRLTRNIGRDHASSGNPSFSNRAASSAPTEPPLAEAMVACAHCGIHFPASEAVIDSSGTVFCGIEHRRLHSS